jgi:S1-C subfamily serine protease
MTRGHLIRVRIQACQMRLPIATKKELRYLWLSSADLLHGTASGSPLHFRFRLADLPRDARIVIVEGVLKADILSAIRPELYIVATPCVTANHGALVELMCGRPVLMAFDQDFYSNETACFQLAALIAKRLCRERTLVTTRIASWDARVKGIDDAAVRNLPITSIHHTIEREEEITVLLHDGREAPATLIGRDASTDLAALKIDDASSAADIADQADALKVGRLVLAVGRTGGEGVSASLGCISAVGGAWRAWQGGIIDHFVRLDLNIYLGFSGSPLVDADGRVLGINTSGLGRGSALTIPAVTVNRVVDALLKGGRVPRPYIGVGMQPVRLPDAIKSKLNLVNNGGVIVLSVEPGSPADNAGFLVGDVLVELGATAITDIDDVQATLAPESVGQTIDASVVRGGERANLAVTIGERSAQRRRGE